MIPVLSLSPGARFRCISGGTWTLLEIDRYLVRAVRDDGVTDVFARSACVFPAEVH
jgi:hypothetical protein